MTVAYTRSEREKTRKEVTQMLKKIRSRKGFTLVELMIVVAIIGILAAIAIPNFLNFRMKAKTSEAKSNLGAIRSTEVAYYAEYSGYVVNQPYTPDHTTAAALDAKQPWDTTTRFSIIGFAPEGAVYFDYQLEALAGDTASMFTAAARGDLDKNNDWAIYSLNDSSNEISKTGGTF
jgi:type IV pilus assembly protein PilA